MVSFFAQILLFVLFNAIYYFYRDKVFTVHGQDYTEKYRPQFHYSVPTGWLNDPNGLIYHDGVYHLFYQHYPDGPTHGDMYWGHAISTDLFHWENLEIALKPTKTGTIFSGCSVVDSGNLTGLARDPAKETLLAIYTLAAYTGEQSQALAYSFDKGLTWQQYEKNPILVSPGPLDFRDPNIIERNGIFYMTLAVADRIMFYSSKNLLNWTPLKSSEFGVNPNQGDKSGVWECPSIISLKDEQNKTHDVLIISENGDARGSLMQYFIGDFNENGFDPLYGESPISWVDHGPDNYAAVPYHNDPSGKPIFIGWMSNWLYGQVTPATNWRGQMTIPREYVLKTVNGRIHLAQKPFEKLLSILDGSKVWMLPNALQLKDEQTTDITSQISFKTGSLLSLKYVFDVNTANSGKISIRFSNNLGEFISFSYYIEERVYELDRSNAGKVAFSPRFAKEPTRAHRIASKNLLNGQIILDRTSIEVFADDGLNTFTAIFYPTELLENIQIYNAIDGNDSGKYVTVQSLSVNGIKGTWNY